MNDPITANQSNGDDVNEGNNPYRVLARKYRPVRFDDLIGQEPMVRTLRNAFDSGRIAQAWMLTGVRGVGKTTTARILARALNYEIEGAVHRPTIDMEILGIHCAAIMEGRHVDIIEMDAASHTSINDIREIIEASRYKPVSARYKVYIIDEVHMLSNAAFNGLLKTLEEPPEHVKFIFATTEIRKVPVTVLSRCQRFDLRRIDSNMMVEYLQKIAKSENVNTDSAALALITRASEGSVRDALSLLDQAIAHGSGTVSVNDLHDMLGLADRARIIDLFEHIMKGDTAAAITELKEQYHIGADPLVIMSDLADFMYFVTRLKILPNGVHDASVSDGEHTRGAEFAHNLSIPVLSRAWQILLKGLDEIRLAPKALAAADMVLIRLCHAANLPTPTETLKIVQDMVDKGNTVHHIPKEQSSMDSTAVNAVHIKQLTKSAAIQPAPQPTASATPVLHFARFEDLVTFVGEKGEIPLQVALSNYVQLVHFEMGRLEFNPTDNAPADLAQTIGAKLQTLTDQRWLVAISRETGDVTLREQEKAHKHQLASDARLDPLVCRVLEMFPGAEVVDVQINSSQEIFLNDPDTDQTASETRL